MEGIGIYSTFEVFKGRLLSSAGLQLGDACVAL